MKWSIAVLVLVAGVAFADPRTEAMLLFDQGQKEMKAGEYEKACNSFERSLALYADSGTKGSLARCYEKAGRLASAWVLWRQLADLAPSADLRKDAAAQAAKLAPRVAHYVLKVTKPAPGMTLTINGKTAALTEVPVPIDAGGVIVRAYAPGRKDWSADLSAVDGKELAIEVPELEVVPVSTDDNNNAHQQPPPPSKPARQVGRGQRLVGMAIAGLGAVTVGVGGVFGIKAQGKFKDAKDLCGGDIDNCSNVAGAQPLVDDARSAGNLSTMLFVAGGAAIVTGIVVFQLSPKPENKVAVTPLASPTTAGVALSGRF